MLVSKTTKPDHCFLSHERSKALVQTEISASVAKKFGINSLDQDELD